MTGRGFRFSCRAATRSPEGRPVLAFGLRVGYWPCLRAPFLELAVGRWRLDFWHGLPSYAKPKPIGRITSLEENSRGILATFELDRQTTLLGGRHQGRPGR